jgi:hypothetical protein
VLDLVANVSAKAMADKVLLFHFANAPQHFIIVGYGNAVPLVLFLK